MDTVNATTAMPTVPNLVPLQQQQGQPGIMQAVQTQGVAGAPNEKALLDLMERTGYQMIQENGQRKYGGPPPGWGDKSVPRGAEIFVGKIPRDCYEDELVPIFEKIGPIYELRLMMDFSGSNRGYCFVMYTKRSDAKRAVRELNNIELPNRRGRFIGVCLSVDNCRLFVGGIPKNKTKEEIMTEMCKVVEDVKDVIVYPSASDKTKNRGFAFVEFDSHRSAAMARRKLIPGRIQLWGHQIAVDWAEPEQDVDEDVMAKVKILYVRNLMLSTTEETLEAVFTQASGSENSVERVKKIRDYAFVHFRDRESAVTALNVLNGKSLEGSTIEVVWAKPVDKQEYQRQSGALQAIKGVPGMLGAPTAAAYGLTAAGTADPLQYAYLQSQLAVAAAAAGRTDYITQGGLQMKGIQGSGRGPMRGRGRGAAGSRAAGAAGRGSMVPGYMRHPAKKPAAEDLIDLLPGMELTPIDPQTLKPQTPKTTFQILEELCLKNGWGSPIYQLHSTTTSREGGNDIQLFLYKVTLPALASQFGTPPFTPNKLCRTVEDAKNIASEYVLLQLGYPVDSSGTYQGAGDASQIAAAAYSNPSAAASLLQQSAAAANDAAAAVAMYQGRPLAAPSYPLTSPSPTIMGSPSDLSATSAYLNMGMTAAAQMPYVSSAGRTQQQLAAAPTTMLAPGLGYQPAGTWFMG